MAKKISELPAALTGTEDDLYPIVQTAQNRKQTRAQLRTAILSGWQSFIGTFLGAANTSAARTSIGAASSGANSDITSLSGLSTALSVAQGGTGSTSAAAARAALGVVNATAGYIDGLNLVWNSANSLSVTSGAAYVSSLGTVLNVPATLTKASLVLTATTWYHVYLYSNAGVADVEIVTTAPSAKVFGDARTKTGDTSRRYLGSIRTAAANTIIRFVQNDTRVSWLADTATTPLAVLVTGVAVVATTVSCSAAVPVTGTHGSIQFICTASGSASPLFANPDAGTVSTTFSQVSITANMSTTMDFSLSSAQTFAYLFSASPGSGAAFARVYGYLFER